MIIKKEYELSVWHETLDENGIKQEIKENIIGAHDMTYLGRATQIKFKKLLNGTHELTFQMPDKYFDSEKGKYVRNEFIDNLFNERKLKLFYLNKWYEFYIKSVHDNKNFKSYMKDYVCTDAFIDELSRNGYGITFSTALYNNVEEIGTFTEEILDGSAWEYHPEYNWGDFTEYLEEKLFKIPVGKGGLFEKVYGHKLDFKLNLSNSDKDKKIKNFFTGKKRELEMGDDYAAHLGDGYFWDDKNGKNPLLSKESIPIEHDGYIYIPYSQLEFCYATTSNKGDTVLVATEEVQYYIDENNEQRSFALAPASVDPTALIEFIAIPKNAEIEIDEAGLIVTKDYTYVMTVAEWNENIKSTCYYQFHSMDSSKEKTFKTNRDVGEPLTDEEAAFGNKAGYYEGYLDKIGDIEVINGKKISVTNRTEINISEEIDQYVTVYNNKSDEYEDLYVNPDGEWIGNNQNYRVCSKLETRQIVPQLARNFVQNGVNMKTIAGWEPQAIYDGENAILYNTLKVKTGADNTEKTDGQVPSVTMDVKEYEQMLNSYLIVTPSYKEEGELKKWKTPYSKTLGSPYDIYNTIINFGIVGQEKIIEAEKVYCLGIKLLIPNEASRDSFKILIGEGSVLTQGEYTIDANTLNTIPVKNITLNPSQSGNEQEVEGYVFIKFKENIKNPYIALSLSSSTGEVFEYKLYGLWFFEAYTKGRDQFEDTEITFRYSGREMFKSVFDTNKIESDNYCITKAISKEDIHNKILFEEDVMPGDTYGYQHYFIQQLSAKGSNKDTGEKLDSTVIADTFKAKKYLSDDMDAIQLNTGTRRAALPLSAQQFTEDDITVSTKYIDLGRCKYYQEEQDKDCSYNGKHICLYQKYGYCPYLFTSEKHCRKIRTLNGEKSNRFNLTQELSKVFEAYPMYQIEHYENGKTKTHKVNDLEKPNKYLFYITEKGQENKLGFRYEKNLQNISRTIKSDQIVTKLYVEDVDSSISKTGLCSIKTAEDNPSKDSFIIDFSYYVKKGLLDKKMVDRDLYGIDSNGLGYLKQLGYLNGEYDKLSSQIINLSNMSFIELQANVETNLAGIEAAQKELRVFKKQIDSYKMYLKDLDNLNSKNDSYKNAVEKYNEQFKILCSTIKELFFDSVTGEYLDITETDLKPKKLDENGAAIAEFFDKMTLSKFKESKWVKDHVYKYGMLGQYNKEYLQIQEWKKQQSNYLKVINKLSLEFFQKYEPFLKEGTWSDSNYITDNAYYFGATEVAAEGAIPKVEYSINVVDLYSLPEYEDYYFDIADTTYVEDIGMFGINPITGLPNRLKVLISSITYDLDVPTQNTIGVQNFTTQFADLFQQVTASVQSLQFNENIYKRSSNFTSNQNISESSLQGTLDSNDLTLLHTSENNITIDREGQSGSNINNHNNKYELDGQGMKFSKDGGQTWSTGVGPEGINASFINTGTLDAGSIRIVDNSYLYFLWDKGGITAYRDPKEKNNTDDVTFMDFARFNKYGLSMVENGQIRLRAGYDFNGLTSGENAGDFSTEQQIGKDIGFFLYNSTGHKIFSTTSASTNDKNIDEQTAKLSLTGEMYVTNDVLSGGGTSYIYSYSKMAYFTNMTVATFGDSAPEFDKASMNKYKINIESFDLQLIADMMAEYILSSNMTQIDESFFEVSVEEDSMAPFYVKIKSFNKESISILDNEIYYIDTLAEKCKVTIGYYTEKTGSEITTTSSGMIVGFRDNKSKYYYQGGNTQIFCKTRIDNSKTEFSKTPFTYSTSLSYYDFTGIPTVSYSKTIDNKNMYYWKEKNVTAYTEFVTVTNKETEKSGVVGLYINNKKAWKSDEENSGDQRLFCCCLNNKENPQSTVENIFTIKKDGGLYIGGAILTVDKKKIESSRNLDDEIIIQDAPIYIENGELHIDFENIKGKGDLSLVDAISSAVANVKLIKHKHTISKLTQTISNKNNIKCAYLPSKTDLSKIYKIDSQTTFKMDELIASSPGKGLTALLKLFTNGTYTWDAGGGVKLNLTFSNKIPLIGEEYDYTLTNSETDYAGLTESTESYSTFSNWAYEDVIQT